MNKPTKTILIVDDESPIRSVLKDALEKAQFTVIEARNGEEGLGTALHQHPDLMMLDIMMPKMHGIELLDRLQADVWGKTAPIILLTNYSEDPRVQQAVQLGRCELLEKEKVKINDIVAKVKDMLGL